MIQFHPVQFPRPSQAVAAISEEGGGGNGSEALQRRPRGGFPPLLLPLREPFWLPTHLFLQVSQGGGGDSRGGAGSGTAATVSGGCRGGTLNGTRAPHPLPSATSRRLPTPSPGGKLEVGRCVGGCKGAPSGRASRGVGGVLSMLCACTPMSISPTRTVLFPGGLHGCARFSIFCWIGQWIVSIFVGLASIVSMEIFLGSSCSCRGV
jgi:hypothetical protein